MSTNPVSVSDQAPVLESFDPVDSVNSRPHHILSAQELGALNVRSNRLGWVQLAGHLSVMGVSGYLWATYVDRWLLALPALVVYGFSLAAMFAPMHECVHRTAFAKGRLNDGVAWFAGLLSLYNSTFYRRYHKWHHRYTQIPDKDPELKDLQLSNLWEYGLEVSGLLWWWGKLRGHFRVAFGQLDDCPFVPETGRDEVMRSTRLQLLVYAGAIALSIAAHQPWFLLYWLLPLAVGQPILRLILLAEHTGCTNDDNPLTNTRTTLTMWPVRFLMWNMPFHAEHHLYTSIPFHALPAAHQKLRPHFAQVESGYLNFNRNLIAHLGKSAP
jgi:fatty acid desaturase